jgi:hypothetical protein
VTRRRGPATVGSRARGRCGTGSRDAWPKEEERKERKERKRRERKRGNKENEIRKKGKGKKKKEKRKEKRFRKLGEILGKLEGRGKRDFVGFSCFSGVSMIFGTAVMARQTGRLDRGMPGIFGEVADSGAGAARCEWRWPECGWCQRDSRHARRGKARGEDDRDFGEVIELSGRVFENTRDFSR